MLRPYLYASLMVTILAHAAPATAQTPGQGTSAANRTLAETLFREARALMTEEKYNQACPKFAESHRLDPASGTLLGLAMCHEAEGKTASAWAEFQQVLAMSRRDGRADRAQFAAERITAIEPLLTRVTILVEAGVEGLVVKLDDVELGPAAFGVATPVDPGAHVLSASAPGSRTWVHRFNIEPDGGAQQTIDVPPLEAAPAEEATTAGAAPQPSTDSKAATPATDTSLSLPVQISGAATLALTAGAIATGFVTLSKASSFDDANDDPNKTFEERDELRNSANNWATVNTVLTSSALVGAAITTYLYVSGAGERAPTAAPKLDVWLGPDVAGVGLSGAL